MVVRRDNVQRIIDEEKLAAYLSAGFECVEPEPEEQAVTVKELKRALAALGVKLTGKENKAQLLALRGCVNE